MGRKAKQRRQSHGSAWHWIQTDCWYYTMPGTKKRVALFVEDKEDPQDSVRPEVAKLTRELTKTAPCSSDRPLFRNTKGDPWQRMTGVVRFFTLKKKLGWDQDPVRGNYSCYTCRHTFVHRMLSGYWTNNVGCSADQLATLLPTPAQ